MRTECLADALDNRVEFGVWGGMTERERRALLRRRPTVTSWRRLLETARTEYERSGGSVLPVDIRSAENYADYENYEERTQLGDYGNYETYESYAAKDYAAAG